jgi:hypothetical protein
MRDGTLLEYPSHQNKDLSRLYLCQVFADETLSKNEQASFLQKAIRLDPQAPYQPGKQSVELMYYRQNIETLYHGKHVRR